MVDNTHHTGACWRKNSYRVYVARQLKVLRGIHSRHPLGAGFIKPHLSWEVFIRGIKRGTSVMDDLLSWGEITFEVVTAHSRSEQQESSGGGAARTLGVGICSPNCSKEMGLTCFLLSGPFQLLTVY